MHIFHHKFNVKRYEKSLLARLLMPSPMLMFVVMYALADVGESMASPVSYSICAPADSVRKDTTIRISKDAPKSKITYHAKDSAFFDIKNKKLYLVNAAVLEYQNMKVEADNIIVDWTSNELYAYGNYDSIADSTRGKPVLYIDNQPLSADTMIYNFNTKKGKMRAARTRQGEGYLYARAAKRNDDESMFMKDGWYTTCSYPHPHFQLNITKIKLIPDKKIISGPAYLVIADVPTPLILPFGFFPINKGQRNGFIIPKFKSEEGPLGRGFGLFDGGYYFHIKDYADMRITGSIFTKGSWILSTNTSYVRRYRYNGGLSVNYNVNKTGEPRTSEQTISKLFYISLNHSLNPLTHPGTSFSANINLQSGGSQGNYLRRNSTNTNDFLNNEIRSNVNYSKSFMKNKMMLSLSANHSQNTLTHQLYLTLPSGQFYINNIYPFRYVTHPGSPKWYEKISTNYVFEFKNELTSNDSLFYTKEQFNPDTLKKYLKNGMSHVIPIGTSVTVLKYFNLAPSATFSQHFYFKNISKILVPNGNYNATKDTVITRTNYEFRAPYDLNLNLALSTRIFGKFNFYHTRLIAVRHVLSPSMSFSYHPDYSKPQYGYYHRVRNPNDTTYATYSIFEGALYGYPAAGETGRLNFSLGNQLESKWKNKSDTLTGTRKIMLLDFLNLNTGYNFLADSMRWDNLSVSGGTSIARKININFGGTFTPYDKDSSRGTEYYVNRFLASSGSKWLNMTEFHAGVVFSLNSELTKKRKSNKGTEQERNDIQDHPYDYIDFNIPWNVNVNYNLSYLAKGKYIVPEGYQAFRQSLSLNGDFNITPNWKLAGNMMIDPSKFQVQYVSVDLYRDLHCWDMRISIRPFGESRGFNFTLQAKSQLLQDLKLTRKFDARYY
jgi:hypothetical protein